ncbi:MAG: NblA/ycf18 family protein [Desmonostoc vinosum HA7617-LM4]|jgi:hypothetical protein|nr:NblA/ycf18 family protein [Desmonostoc vinosum HA7617-LM4]
MNSAKLTLEQHFKLKVLEMHVQKLSQQQVQKLLIKCVQIGMIKDNIISQYADISTVNVHQATKTSLL